MTSKAPSGGDAFLAALSHELRTPLNGVLGMAGLLARTRLDGHQRAYVEALQQSGEHLLGLVNDVLDLARLDSGGFRLHPAPTDIELLLQSTAELLSPRAHAKGLEIAWAAEAGLPKVMADEGRLRQILFNLAGNAVKFTETGGVLLTAHRTAGAIRFTVRDTGPGVAEADRERIFEPFAQGAAATVESTGLGLAIVRRLTEAFGGRLGLESAPDEGASFWFEADLPACPGAAEQRSLKGVEVAVVTRSAVVAEAAQRQVEACGGRAVIYPSLAAAQRAPVGAPVLVDCPAAGRTRPKPAPGRASIVLLAPEQRSRLPALRRAGFAGYLIKPLRRRSLATRILAVIAGAVEKVQAEDERIRPAAAQGARVLMAEDNPINAMLGRALLEREGCTVDRVQTGPQAVEAASTQAYDLILLDLRMPGLGGIEAAQAIRARGVATPIAALTADAFEESRRACLKAGMQDFLSKPLDPEALRALLARLAFTEPEAHAKLAS